MQDSQPENGNNHCENFTKLNVFFFYFFTQSKKLSANKNWQFQTRTSLASL